MKTYSMIFFTENEIDKLIEDDVPLGDMTSYLLELSGQQASIALSARHETAVCCTEEAERMYEKAGLTVTYRANSGALLKKGEKIIEAHGDAAAVHLIWRTGLAMIEFASGIAERTRELVSLARTRNPDVTVAGTRKHPPFLKKIALKALMAGGGVPHRTGLSDTILLFREHLNFVGGYEKMQEIVAKIRSKQKERKIVVEAHTFDQAILCVKAGVDAVQTDKIPTEEFKQCVQQCKTINPNACIIAAGGINNSNAADYANCGADVLVTSWMYFAPPSDIQAKVTPL